MTMNTVTNYCEGVKYENPDKFAHILPTLGSFHIEMSFMSDKDKRRRNQILKTCL